MRIGVKICGVSTPPAIEACIEADVDWVGFVFYDRSPRAVSPARAATLISMLPTRIEAVGLFVEPSDGAIETALALADLAALQIYATAERIAEIAARVGRPVWHAKPVAAAGDLPSATAAERLVIEGKATGSDRPGGNAAALDWSMLARWRPPSPWLLAGGLRPDNVAEAIRASGAVAVDVSSGVETRPGVKDTRAILAFTRAARAHATGAFPDELAALPQ